jgi:hypothetical protein
MFRSACRGHGGSWVRTGRSTRRSRSASAPPGEHFEEYLLDDGVIPRIKHVLTEVWKAREAYDSYGNPLYFAVQSPVLVVDAPDELREGGDW